MDDPEWSWPAWKFGLKRDDLFSSLHDRYNTFTSTIQDPEAFHHDVYEISQDAHNVDEFHRLLADRQRQRLRELHVSLESLAVEIIANPTLMDSEHWQYALQLFRTKSFDSIVRYFASYLPESHLKHNDNYSTSSSFSEAPSVETASTDASSVDDLAYPPCLTDDDMSSEGHVMTEEPCSFDFDHSEAAPRLRPYQPKASECEATFTRRGEAALQEEDASTNPPSPSMSYSGSESAQFGRNFLRRSLDRDVDEFSQPDDIDAAVTTISDCAESHSSLDSVDAPLTPVDDDIDQDEFLTAQFPDDDYPSYNSWDEFPESDTPTPKQEAMASCYIEYKSVASRRIPSPHRRSPSPRALRKDGAQMRRTPEEAQSKVQKPAAEYPIRRRPKGKTLMA